MQEVMLLCKVLTDVQIRDSGRVQCNKLFLKPRGMPCVSKHDGSSGALDQQ